MLRLFDMYSSLEDLEKALSAMKRCGDVPGVHEAQVPLIRAIIWSIKGSHENAAHLIDTAAANSQGSPFKRTVTNIANRLGVEHD